MAPSTDPMIVDKVSDDELVDRARQGDDRAFEQLYRLHSGRVHGLCLRMVRDADLAVELTQRAFIRAWQRLEAFEGRSTFATWLYRLATNTSLDEIRWRHRDVERHGETPPGLSTRSAPDGLAIDLRDAIDDLPEGARRVFLLYEIEGLRHQEIAEAMGISEGTSKGQLHRARRLLRERLR